jgi:tRNA dimethylallyltransferase
MHKKSKIICLMGPTASGKTDLAVELTRHLPCAIISVDSAMVYRGMDIGTAKPSPELLAEVPHRLIDIRDPHDAYSAADFCKDALFEINTLLTEEKIPLLVGGTMLYFRALQQGLSSLPAANAKVRAQLLLDAEKEGWESLHTRLKQIDPESALRIHPNDPQRLQRALEVYLVSGKTLTQHCLEDARRPIDFDVLNLAIAPNDRSILHDRIHQRFEKMLSQGFIEEVDGFFKRGDLSPDLPSMRAVGYRQVWDYLAGNSDHDQMQERATAATRQLAKRQLTWLRSWDNLIWQDSEHDRLLEKVLAALKF